MTIQTTSPQVSIRGTEVNLTAYTGVTFKLVLTLTNEDGSPIDLSSYAGVLSGLDGKFLLTSAADQITVSGFSNNVLTAVQTAATMDNSPTGEGRYSLVIVPTGGGDTVLILRGVLRVVNL